MCETVWANLQARIAWGDRVSAHGRPNFACACVGAHLNCACGWVGAHPTQDSAAYEEDRARALRLRVGAHLGAGFVPLSAGVASKG